jgi:hypothetical protein
MTRIPYCRTQNIVSHSAGESEGARLSWEVSSGAKYAKLEWGVPLRHNWRLAHMVLFEATSCREPTALELIHASTRRGLTETRLRHRLQRQYSSNHDDSTGSLVSSKANQKCNANGRHVCNVDSATSIYLPHLRTIPSRLHNSGATLSLRHCRVSML